MHRFFLSLLLLLTTPLIGQSIAASARAEFLTSVVVPPNGSRAEVAVAVDACDSLTVTTSFQADSVKVHFVKPDGSRLEWQEGVLGLAFSMQEVTAEEEGEPASFVYQARVASPTPGPWKIVIQWPEPQWAGTGTVVYASFLGSPIELNVFTPGSSYSVGTSVYSTLALYENRQPYFKGNITATLIKDEKIQAPVTFNLKDIPELKAQTLLAELPLSGPGHYVLFVEVSGTSVSGKFLRTACTDFDVYIPKGKVTGTFSSSVD